MRLPCGLWNIFRALFLIAVILCSGDIATATDNPVFNPETDLSLIPASQMRKGGLHNAGKLHFPISDGVTTLYPDPETGQYTDCIYSPPESSHIFGYASLWVGGVIGSDSIAVWPYVFSYPDPSNGSMYRTGRSADDEFVAVFTDTTTDYSYYKRLEIEITQISYSWHDSAYADFVIIDYVIKNIGSNSIQDGWIGLYLDNGVYDTNRFDYPYGEYDDPSGVLDTLLYDDVPTSRVLIPYGYDNDGDPDSIGWSDQSVRDVISIGLLGTSIKSPTINYNWWTCSYNELNFGPRRLETPDDPFYDFHSGELGRPVTQRDDYYIMAHEEIDYNLLEIHIHDSTDGWIPFPPIDDPVFDVRFLYSFGPFDLAPGDSVTCAFAVIVSENIHSAPDDFDKYYDPYSPHEFQNRLDFTDLMINHRKADSVYRSGFTLPKPGPPVGLKITDYNDGYVDLVWNPSAHPAVEGYYINVVDTSVDSHWRHIVSHTTSDTTFRAPMTCPAHEHFFAVSILDTSGSESARSFAVGIVPGRPHQPQNLTISSEITTPILEWQPHCDTSLLAYLIYRAIGDGDFELYDSTTAIRYYDYDAVPGIFYHYMVSAQNNLGLESPPTESVQILPMALDRGILFYDMNYDNSVIIDCYRKEYIDELFSTIRHITAIDYHDIEYEPMTLIKLTDYSMVIFDAEKGSGRFPASFIDSLRLYMEYGGKALFIMPNASTRFYLQMKPVVNHFSPGDLFHDVLYLDSNVTNGLVFYSGTIYGDLIGCQSVSINYPDLEVDTNRLKLPDPLILVGSVPLSGCLYPREGVEILYRYQSLYPDSQFHNTINGIKRIDDNGGFVLFNFPLSLMAKPNAINALHQALTDLGVDLTCGDVNTDGRFNLGDPVALLNYLFSTAPLPPDLRRADVNCDGLVNIEDALIIINLILKDGSRLDCCPIN